MANGRRGSEGLGEELSRERERMRGRCLPCERVLELLPGVLAGPPGRFVESAWSHRTFQAWWERPRLLLAALRQDALLEGKGHPLHAALAATAPRADAVTREALGAALDGTRDRVFDALAHRGVRTDEPSRAVAWLWPAALAGLSHGARPVALAAVGAGAGLNLVADLLPPVWTDEAGVPLEVARGIGAVARLGLDRAPLDATSQEDAAWLRACVWPGEGERLARLDAALAAFRTARTRPDGPVLAPVAATAVPARLDVLSGTERGAVVLAYQTVVRDHLSRDERAEYEAGMRNWVASQPPGHALWVELEPMEAELGPDRGAAITAHFRGLDGALRDVRLARCGLLPSRIIRESAGVRELQSRLAETAPGAAHV